MRVAEGQRGSEGVREGQGGCVRESVHLGKGNLTSSLNIWTQKQYQKMLANFENSYFETNKNEASLERA